MLITIIYVTVDLDTWHTTWTCCVAVKTAWPLQYPVYWLYCKSLWLLHLLLPVCVDVWKCNADYRWSSLHMHQTQCRLIPIWDKLATELISFSSACSVELASFPLLLNPASIFWTYKRTCPFNVAMRTMLNMCIPFKWHTTIFNCTETGGWTRSRHEKLIFRCEVSQQCCCYIRHIRSY